MPAVFFADETDLALAAALERLHGDAVYPGHPDLPEVPRRSIDDVWLPVVGRRKLVVITRDKRIRYRPVEKQRWVEHRVRGFVLTGQSSQSTAASLDLLEYHRSALLSTIASRPEGPWMFSVTAAGLREIQL